MSKQLTLSAALSIALMAGFALFGQQAAAPTALSASAVAAPLGK